MKANGILGMMAAVKELFGGKYFWMTSVAMPMRSATATAPGRERSRAATTAANAAAISVVMPVVFRPVVGATSTPARPARPALTAHTPTEIRPELVPDSDD